MRKVPTLFLRNPADMKHVLPDINPECRWVIDGEGIATRKFDGTCVMHDAVDRAWLARREIKPGKPPTVPFFPIETDPATGKTVGWIHIEDSSFYRWFMDVRMRPADPGTYELIGPKINGNPEGVERHELIRHGAVVLPDAPRSHEALRVYLAAHPFEGIVWHHEDGRMAKIKARDFPT